MAGENVKMKVKGIDESDIKRGDVLCNNLNYCQETFEFKATLNVLELPEKKKIVAAGSECVLHMHAISEQVEIIKVESKYDAASKKFIAATFLKPGDQGGVIIRVPYLFILVRKHSLSGEARVYAKFRPIYSQRRGKVTI